MSTSTRRFGASRRESHDSSAFYARALAPAVFSTDEALGEVPDDVAGQVFAHTAEAMTELPDSSVALMVTSPPYHAGKSYDSDDSFEDYLGLLERVFTEVHRVLEPGGRAAVNVANLGRKPYLPLSHLVTGLLGDLGFHMRGEIIWQKARGASGSCAFGTYSSAKNPVLRDLHEYVLVFSKGRMGRVRTGSDTIEPEDFLRDTLSIWEIPAESARRVGHPAPFPVELPRRLIELYTFADDVVLDPFLGSGSTAVAAIEAGRRFVGYDTVEEYVALARDRVADAEARVAALPPQAAAAPRSRPRTTKRAPRSPAPPSSPAAEATPSTSSAAAQA